MTRTPTVLAEERVKATVDLTGEHRLPLIPVLEDGRRLLGIIKVADALRIGLGPEPGGGVEIAADSSIWLG